MGFFQPSEKEIILDKIKKIEDELEKNKTLYDMHCFEARSIHDRWHVTRVPGGWIFVNIRMRQIFVPFTKDQFTNERLKEELKKLKDRLTEISEV